MDMMAVLEKIAVPRPNHSDALDRTAVYLKELLTSWGIPFSVQEFPLRPYFMLFVGITVLLLAVGFAFAVYKKRPVASLLLALAILTVLVLEYEFFVPVTSWLVQKKGENIIMHFPSSSAVRELIFCAHYDSKTDFWDHIQRARLYQFIPAAIVMSILLALWTFFVRQKGVLAKKISRIITLTLAGIFVLYIGLLALGFGGFVFVPERNQSYGAVDNGGSVVSLLALARDINDKKIDRGSSSVTILLTAGEEVNLQGAHQYVREFINIDSRKEKIPRYCVNLELAGQKGNLFYARKIGVFLKFYAASPELVSRMESSWRSVTGRSVDAVKSITDDSQRFMAAGIPSITIGHNGIPGMGMGGFHSEKDNMGRVDPDNLELMVKVLEKFIEGFR
jgi:acetylornithine deacetylase/succinyl-diaminopimelate desuccinylase-like protein